MIKLVDTFSINIFLGLREGYTETIHSKQEVEYFIQKYVDVEKLCVTVTETKFIYVNGNEPGLIIGLINYPRFPSDFLTLKDRALDLGEKLRIFCNQERVSLVCNSNNSQYNKTYMLEGKSV